MMTKLLALWIVALAVSPFTEPFSTFKFGDLTSKGNAAAHRRSATGLVCAMAFDATETTEFPDNPPIDVRPMVSVDTDVRVSLALPLAGGPIVFDHGSMRPRDRDPLQGLQIPLAGRLAVLRL